STDDKDYILEEPFIVLATQNPLEYQGTFPLPEAQLDRFLMRISIGYPEKDFEEEILKNYKNIKPNILKPVANREDILDMQEKIENLTVHNDIIKYIINISNATRDSKDIQLGASPRASIDLLRAAKSKAFLENRDYIIPDDVKEMVIPVFAHRIILSPEARIERKTPENILEELVKTIFVPVI
ncbi:MAG: MoxR family ATPase, partial [Tissierellia bacterium]|nr:MoxR family ATPase [Tissierellia bacterium]